MVTYVYRLSDGLFLYGGSTTPTHDPATQGVVKLAVHPNRATDRYDPSSETQIRPATVPEIAAYDAEQKDAAAQAVIDRDQRVLALAEYLRQELNTVRAALPTPLPNITRLQALAAIRTIWKSL